MDRGLLYSKFSTVIMFFCAIRSERIRRICRKLALFLEGGEYKSGTLRKILKKYYGVTVGAFSYGACTKLNIFPPGVKIGRYVSVANGVRVILHNHPYDRLSMHPFFYNPELGYVDTEKVSFKPLEIGHDAWIGDGAKILPNCNKIGIGAVIGAGAVVTKDVPNFAIVAVNPSKIIKMRFSQDVCDLILKSKWWEKDIKEMGFLLNNLGGFTGEKIKQNLDA